MAFWYKNSVLQYLFWPFHGFLVLLVWLRRFMYKKGWLSSYRASIPVIIVGNISVGGTGKSPVVISLAQELIRRGYQPAIVSRGYGGHSNNYPLEVTRDTPVRESGDEAWMMANRINCPVVVDPLRARAADLITASFHCDLIISDDGLQHYALDRDYEITLVEAQRFLGNGLLMPFGPLREPVSRLASVDAVVVNHRFDSHTEQSSLLRQKGLPVFDCHFSAQQFRALKQVKHLSIQEFVAQYKQVQLHAFAGIGNPDAFFDYLTGLGLQLETHVYPDHHQYNQADFDLLDGPIIMTEKDASKCYDMELDDVWYLTIESHLTPNLVKSCLQHLGLENHKS